ncbi:MAG: preprotein translocase subunit YajC [Verrucomicrobia bacterium 61-8]|nr:preprotein translocase subunit YajC [Verrucomicrobiota bacterium]OJU98733.1 MAG: preprotein translocase subunit YajC [Verrucomicrobia bacterium 61-8]
MNLHTLLILAQSTPAAGGAPQQNVLVQMIPLVLIFVIFYFLLIRPQQKRQKEHEKLVSALKTGDHVITNAGIHGIIVNVKDRSVLIKVADNVKIEFDRAAIATVDKSSEASAEETKA